MKEKQNNMQNARLRSSTGAEMKKKTPAGPCRMTSGKEAVKRREKNRAIKD